MKGVLMVKGARGKPTRLFGVLIVWGSRAFRLAGLGVGASRRTLRGGWWNANCEVPLGER